MRVIKAILALILLAIAVSATAQTAIPTPTYGTNTQMTTVLGGWGSKLLMKIPIKDTTVVFTNVPDSGRITIQPSTGILYWHNGSSWRTISAGTTYLAGYGLSLTGVTFSADTTVLVSKAYLTAVLANYIRWSDTTNKIATKSDFNSYLLKSDSNIIATKYDLSLLNYRIFDVDSFGAIPNDGLDDSEPIQAAINAADAAGGGKVVGFGVYDVKNEPDRAIEYPWDNSQTYIQSGQLYIPLKRSIDSMRCVIEICPRYQVRVNKNMGTYDSNCKYSTNTFVIRSTENNFLSGDRLLQCSGTIAYNANQVYIHDMAFVLNSRVALGGARMGVIDNTVGNLRAERCFIGVDTFIKNVVYPQNANNSGIRGSNTLDSSKDNSFTVVEDCIFFGLTTGLRISTNTYANNNTSFGCNNGLMFTVNSGHGSCYVPIHNSKYCRNDVSGLTHPFTDSSNFYLGLLNVDIYSDTSVWLGNRNTVNDANNVCKGNLWYNINLNGVQRNDLFIQNGGTRLIAYPYTQRFQTYITPSTTNTWYRGDKTFQSLTVSAVTGLQTALDSNVKTDTYTAGLALKADKSTTLTTNTPLTGSTTLASNITLGINDAAADSLTKGAATFTTADFNSSGGIISLDYAHMLQAAVTTANLLLKLDANGITSTGGNLGLPNSLSTVSATSGTLSLQDAQVTSSTGTSVSFGNASIYTNTSGARNIMSAIGTFSPTSGTGRLTVFSLVPTINQTGGASGITRCIFISPVISAAADWRSLEIGNSVGHAIYSSGTAPSYHLGELHLGSSTDAGAYQLQVTGAMYLTSAPTSAGSYVALTRNTSTSAVESVTLSSVATAGVAITDVTDISSTAITATGSLSSTKADVVRTIDATSGNITLTLNALAGQKFFLSRIDASINTVTIVMQSGNINGAANDLIATQYLSNIYIYNGSQTYKY